MHSDTGKQVTVRRNRTGAKTRRAGAGTDSTERSMIRKALPTLRTKPEIQSGRRKESPYARAPRDEWSTHTACCCVIVRIVHRSAVDVHTRASGRVCLLVVPSIPRQLPASGRHLVSTRLPREPRVEPDLSMRKCKATICCMKMPPMLPAGLPRSSQGRQADLCVLGVSHAWIRHGIKALGPLA